MSVDDGHALTPSPSTLGEGGGEGLLFQVTEDADPLPTLSQSTGRGLTARGHCTQMRNHASSQRPQVVSAFEHADDTSVAMRICDGAESLRDPREAVFAHV